MLKGYHSPDCSNNLVFILQNNIKEQEIDKYNILSKIIYILYSCVSECIVLHTTPLMGFSTFLALLQYQGYFIAFSDFIC